MLDEVCQFPASAAMNLLHVGCTWHSWTTAAKVVNLLWAARLPLQFNTKPLKRDLILAPWKYVPYFHTILCQKPLFRTVVQTKSHAHSRVKKMKQKKISAPLYFFLLFEPFKTLAFFSSIFEVFYLCTIKEWAK